MTDTVIEIPHALLRDIENAAADAYPEESCGLLIGHDHGAGQRLVISRIAISANVSAGDRRKSFEVDPQLRFDLMRELKESRERIVGHFHSHPGGPAEPSARDRDQAWEPELVWLVTAVADAKAPETKAHILDAGLDAGAGRFREIALRIVD